MNWFLQQVFCNEVVVLDYVLVFAVGKRLFTQHMTVIIQDLREQAGTHVLQFFKSSQLWMP